MTGYLQARRFQYTTLQAVLAKCCEHHVMMTTANKEHIHGSEQCCQMPLFQSPTLMTETTFKSAHVHNCDDQRWDLNRWWTNHLLGAIFWDTQRLVTHLVMTIWLYHLPMIITTFLENIWRVVPSNKMCMLSCCVCFNDLLDRMRKHVSE